MAKSPEHVWDLGFLVAWRAHTWYGRGAGGWWVRGGPIFVVGNVERAIANEAQTYLLPVACVMK